MDALFLGAEASHIFSKLPSSQANEICTHYINFLENKIRDQFLISLHFVIYLPAYDIYIVSYVKYGYVHMYIRTCAEKVDRKLILSNTL